MKKTNSLSDFLASLPARFERVLEVPLEFSGSFVDLASRFADEAGTVALLSGGSHDSARYDVLGLRPWLLFREHGGVVTVESSAGSKRFELDPFDALEAVASRYALPGLDESVPLSAG